MNYEAWRITFQSSEQAARTSFDTVRRMSGEQAVLAEMLRDAVAVLRTVDPEDSSEGELLEGLISRAEKAYGEILTPNAKTVGPDAALSRQVPHE